jgi:hypothetical protein
MICFNTVKSNNKEKMNNGVMQPVSRQRICKEAYNNTVLLEKVFAI